MVLELQDHAIGHENRIQSLNIQKELMIFVYDTITDQEHSRELIEKKIHMKITRSFKEL